MKRILTLFSIITLVGALGLKAQDTAAVEGIPSPNRMLVVNSLGQFVAFNTDHIADIRFVNLETPPQCHMELRDFAYERTSVDIHPNRECSSYRFELIPAETHAFMRTDLDLINWLLTSSDAHAVTVEDSEPLLDFQLAGEGELVPGRDYVLILAACDRYGVWDGALALPFTGPEPQLVGHPGVEVSYSFKSGRNLEARMVPNADCMEFSYVFGTAGRYQQHFENWKDTLGFTSFEDMVNQIGTHSKTVVWEMWEQLPQGEDFELIIVCTDARGTLTKACVTPISVP